MSKVHLPNIEKAFKFKITKSGKEYRCDTCLPGTPLVGGVRLRMKRNIICA